VRPISDLGTEDGQGSRANIGVAGDGGKDAVLVAEKRDRAAA